MRKEWASACLPAVHRPLLTGATAQVCQWVFGALAGHAVLARTLDLIVYRFLLDRRAARPHAFQPHVMQTTGPWVFTMAVEEALWGRGLSLDVLLNLTQPVTVAQMRVLPGALVRGDVSEPKAWGSGWVVHMFAGSWKSPAATA